MHNFVRIQQKIVPTSSIVELDVTKIEDLEVTVVHDGGRDVVSGVEAIDLLMIVKPSAMEGKRLRWIRGAWAFHNLVGHPLMQLLAWIGLPGMGIRVHDGTVPKPVGRKSPR